MLMPANAGILMRCPQIKTASIATPPLRGPARMVSFGMPPAHSRNESVGAFLLRYECIEDRDTDFDLCDHCEGSGVCRCEYCVENVSAYVCLHSSVRRRKATRVGSVERGKLIGGKPKSRLNIDGISWRAQPIIQYQATTSMTQTLIYKCVSLLPKK